MIKKVVKILGIGAISALSIHTIFRYNKKQSTSTFK
jgi:hypothetical protein